MLLCKVWHQWHLYTGREGANCVGMIVMVIGVCQEYSPLTVQYPQSSLSLSLSPRLCHLSISCPTSDWRPHLSKLTTATPYTPHTTRQIRNNRFEEKLLWFTKDTLILRKRVLTHRWNMSWEVRGGESHHYKAWLGLSINQELEIFWLEYLDLDFSHQTVFNASTVQWLFSAVIHWLDDHWSVINVQAFLPTICWQFYYQSKYVVIIIYLFQKYPI